MRGRRLVVAQEPLLETRADESIAQILFTDFERGGNGDVGVDSEQWFVGNSLRERMVPFLHQQSHSSPVGRIFAD